jgi:hypothetical protein
MREVAGFNGFWQFRAGLLLETGSLVSMFPMFIKVHKHSNRDNEN